MNLSAHYLTLSCHPDKSQRPPFYGSLSNAQGGQILRQGNCHILGPVRIGGHETLPRTFDDGSIMQFEKQCLPRLVSRSHPTESVQRPRPAFSSGLVSLACRVRSRSSLVRCISGKHNYCFATLGRTLNFRNQDRRSSHQPSSEPLWYVSALTRQPLVCEARNRPKGRSCIGSPSPKGDAGNHENRSSIETGSLD